MEQLFNNFVKSASIFEKGVFLMIAGVCFVFVVQLVFYLVVKVWPKGKP
ncbi:MAG: hypothetical protein FWC45_09415 [Treponema sp.]|nr:hypothetical protein [Treponema sp.]